MVDARGDARLGGSDCLPLVGRERETQTLQFAFRRALDGRGGVVLVSGEAGIGKTALVQSFALEAVDQDTLILQGYCYDLSPTLPYGLWLELTDRYPEDGELPRLPDTLRRGAGIGDLPHQMALFEIAREFLVTLAHQQPLLVVLEDIHWADQASLDLMRYLARHLDKQRILLIATFRDDEAQRGHLVQLLPEIVRESQTLRIELPALGEPAVAQLVDKRFNIRSADRDALVQCLLSKAEGNALFTIELLRSLEYEGALHQTEGQWRLREGASTSVPNLIQLMVDRRMADLSATTYSALQFAAVIGQIVSLQTWEQVLGAATVAVAAEESLASQIVTEAADAQGVTFRHALVREAVYASLTLPRRRLVHRQVADALIEQSQPDPDIVAYHLQRAGDPRAAAWLILAGQQAERRFAWHEAFERQNQAAENLRRTPDSEPQLAGVLLKIGRLLRFSEPRRGLASIEEAHRVALRCGDSVIAALALFWIGVSRCNLGDPRSGIRDMRTAVDALSNTSDDLARASRWSETLGTTDTHPLSTASGTLAFWLALTGRLCDAVSTAERQLQLDWREAASTNNVAGVVHDSRSDLFAYIGLGVALAALGQHGDAKLALHIAREITKKLHLDPLGFVTANIQLALAFALDATDLRQRHELKKAIKENAYLMNESVGMHNVSWGYEYCLLHEGSWSELRTIIKTQDPPTLSGLWNMAMSVRTRLAWYEGNTDHAWDLLHTLLPGGILTHPQDYAHVFPGEPHRIATGLALASGDLELARTWLEAHDEWLAQSDAVLGKAEGLLLWGQLRRAEGNADAAREFAERALEMARNPEQTMVIIASHRSLGELAAASGKVEAARHHIQQSLRLAEAGALPYQRALTQLLQAELEVSHGDPEDARSLLTNLSRVSTGLGARPIVERAKQLLAEISPIRLDKHFGLSPRERDVVCLLVRGLSDKQIAHELFISPNTVIRHVASIRRKLNVDSRTGAVAIALRNQLV